MQGALLPSSVITQASESRGAGLRESFAIVLNPAYMLPLTNNSEKNPTLKALGSQAWPLQSESSARCRSFCHLRLLAARCTRAVWQLGVRISCLSGGCTGQRARRDSQVTIANVAYTN